MTATERELARDSTSGNWIPIHGHPICGRMRDMILSHELIVDLNWLSSNWEKKLVNLSPYNSRFYAALRRVIDSNGSPEDLWLVIDGTLGKIADGYAHLLDVSPEELVSNPWAALRRLGSISERLRAATIGPSVSNR